MALLRELIQPASLERCGDRSFPVLSMTMHDGIMLQSDRFKKSLASVDQSAYKVVRRNQLVVGFPIDEGVLYIQQVADAGIMSPAYDVWNVDETKVNLQYLELGLHSPQSMMFYRTNLRGTTARRRSLPKETLLSLPVPVPSMERQREIASTIARLKELIKLRQRQLRTLDTLIKARFVEMFGDPEYNEKGWPIKKLYELCNVGSSKRIYQEEQTMEGVPFWRISDLVAKMDTGNVESSLFIPENRYEELKAQGLVPEPGDILVTSRGTLGRCYIVAPDDRFYFQDGMISWLSQYKDAITPLYIQFLFSMPGFRKQIDGMQAGSTVAYLSIAMLKKLDIMLPGRDVQEQFAAFVSQVDKSKVVECYSAKNIGNAV